MNKTTSDKPIFFQRLDDFIQGIPKRLPVQYKNELIDQALLDDYLNHYSLNINSTDYCEQYEIWQSDINDYRVIEHRWQAKQPNGKYIILCHGYFDHTLLYGKVIRWALKQGYGVHGFDLPGHGLSSGEPASINSFDQYSRALSHIINREKYSYYLCLGQSTGCAIIINALLDTSITLEENGQPEKIVLLAPLVRSIHWPLLRWPYRLLHRFIPYINRTFADSSHDEMFNHFLRHSDPLQSKKLPLKWIGAMDEWSKKIKKMNRNEQLSCTIIQGTLDNTVDYNYNIQEIQRCLPNTRIHYIDGAYHHLANEAAPYWLEIEKVLSLNISE